MIPISAADDFIYKFSVVYSEDETTPFVSSRAASSYSKRFPSFVSFSTEREYAIPEPEILGDKMDITSSVSVAGPYVTTEEDASFRFKLRQSFKH